MRKGDVEGFEGGGGRDGVMLMYLQPTPHDWV
jgi:hypothetical protein